MESNGGGSIMGRLGNAMAPLYKLAACTHALLRLAAAPTYGLHNLLLYRARLGPTTVSPCELKGTGSNVEFFGTDGQVVGGILG